MEENAKFLCYLFKSKKPFLIGRNGTIELEVVSKYLTDVKITDSMKDKLELHAGIFPQDCIVNWCSDYIDALKNADVMAEGWYTPLKHIEKIIMDKFNEERFKILLRNLEPYYTKPELRWTQYLADKRVAIINSFAETCETQTYISKAIWKEDAESLLPSSTTWIPINTYYSPKLAQGKANWPYDIKNYKKAIAYIIAKVMLAKVDVAIIGCGGLGMILGSELKKRGLQVIVMGGATQILFGIKGKRWENHEIISKFFNDAWINPESSCIPNGFKQIENGCYW